MAFNGFKARLRQFIGERSIRSFALSAKLSPSTLNSVLDDTADRGPSADTLVKIAEATDVNLNWLMLGEGPMLRTVEARIGKAEMDAAIKDRLDAATLVYLEAMKEAGSPAIDPQLAISLRDQLVFGSIDKAKLVSTLKALSG